MGNWEAALGSAELVLKKEAKNPGAVLIKAEALFNLCDFEHSLLHFCRGQVILSTTFLFPSQLLREPTISEMVFVKTSHFREPKFFPNSSRKNYVRMSFAAFPSFQGIFSRNFTTCHVTDFKSILTFGLLSCKIRIFSKQVQYVYVHKCLPKICSGFFHIQLGLPWLELQQHSLYKLLLLCQLCILQLLLYEPPFL